MTLHEQIAALAEKISQTYQEGQKIPGGKVANYDMLLEHVDADNALSKLMKANLPAILSALKLAERMEDPGMVDRLSKSLYASSCANDPIEPREPDWGRGGYKTQVMYWEALARDAIAAMKGEP